MTRQLDLDFFIDVCDEHPAVQAVMATGRVRKAQQAVCTRASKRQRTVEQAPVPKLADGQCKQLSAACKQLASATAATFTGKENRAGLSNPPAAARRSQLPAAIAAKGGRSGGARARARQPAATTDASLSPSPQVPRRSRRLQQDPGQAHVREIHAPASDISSRPHRQPTATPAGPAAPAQTTSRKPPICPTASVPAELGSRAAMRACDHVNACHEQQQPPRADQGATSDPTCARVVAAGQERASQTPAAATHPETNWFDPLDADKVHVVQMALHTGHVPTGSAPLCRERQVQELSGLLDRCISCAQGGSVYVSGMPGTGKSLTVHEVVRSCWHAAATSQHCQIPPALVSISCMALQDGHYVYQRLLDGCALASLKDNTITIPAPSHGAAPPRCDALVALKKLVQQPVSSLDRRASSTPDRRTRLAPGSAIGQRGMLVVVLDEVDCLAEEILHELFLLAQLPRSRLVVIGISNSIDLTERKLAGLQAHGRKPDFIPFPTYSHRQLVELLQQRLATLPGPVFHPKAVELCARKIEVACGDMRRALDACSAALEALVAHAHEAAVTTAMRKLVSVGDMAAAVAKLSGGLGRSSVVVKAMKDLPQQQQLVLCCAAKLLGDLSASVGTPATVRKCMPATSRLAATPLPASQSRRESQPSSSARKSVGGTPGQGGMARARDATLGQLHASYLALCRKMAFKPLSSLEEFNSVCSTLADQSLLLLGKGSDVRQRRVTLRVAEEDVMLALQDSRILQACH